MRVTMTRSSNSDLASHNTTKRHSSVGQQRVQSTSGRQMLETGPRKDGQARKTSARTGRHRRRLPAARAAAAARGACPSAPAARYATAPAPAPPRRCRLRARAASRTAGPPGARFASTPRHCAFISRAQTREESQRGSLEEISGEPGSSCDLLGRLCCLHAHPPQHMHNINDAHAQHPTEMGPE